MWQPFEEGHTIGRRGTEGGVILRDDEHPDGARITLEERALHAPYAITCGVYGWLVHTRFMADLPTAEHAYEQMQAALAAIVAQIPLDDESADDNALDAVQAAVDDFMRQFP